MTSLEEDLGLKDVSIGHMDKDFMGKETEYSFF